MSLTTSPSDHLTAQEKNQRDLHAAPVLASILAEGKAAPDGVRVYFDLIAQHLFEGDFNVDELHRLANLPNQKSLGRTFSLIAGEPLGKYIRRHRCAVAAVLFLKTPLEIWQVSHLVGYIDVDGTGLRRAFDKVYQTTPSRFRKDPESSPLYADLTENLLAPPLGTPPVGRDDLLQLSRSRIDILDEQVRAAAPHLADAVHLRGAERAAIGDVDGGHDDFVLARLCDDAAGDTEPRLYRRVLLSCDTEAFFVDALCPDCRRTLQDDVAADARRHMRQALALVPRSLEWFKRCCDDCYRLYWDAIDRARLGLLEDAFHAWWISEHAKDADGVPASRGLFIRVLFESEKLAHRKPRKRLEMCRRAGGVARELGDADLENLARIYEGNALRAVSDFHEAREVFGRVDTRSCLWLRAWYLRYRGTLDTEEFEIEMAVEQLRSSVELFRQLDTHTSSLVQMKLAEALKWQGEIQKALRSFESLIPDLDFRRWPEAVDFVQIRHALHLMSSGEYNRAEQCLANVPKDSLLRVNLTAAHGELRLAQGDTQTARSLLEEAISGMIERQKFDDAVFLTLEVAETHAAEGYLSRAIDTAMTALTYSASSLRTKQVLQAVSQLADYSDSARELANKLRKLAWQGGGTLPPPVFAQGEPRASK